MIPAVLFSKHPYLPRKNIRSIHTDKDVIVVFYMFSGVAKVRKTTLPVAWRGQLIIRPGDSSETIMKNYDKLRTGVEPLIARIWYGVE